MLTPGPGTAQPTHFMSTADSPLPGTQATGKKVEGIRLPHPARAQASSLPAFLPRLPVPLGPLNGGSAVFSWDTKGFGRPGKTGGRAEKEPEGNGRRP